MINLLIKKHPGTPPDWVNKKLLERLEKEGIPLNQTLTKCPDRFAYWVSSWKHKPWKDFSWEDMDGMVLEGSKMIIKDKYGPNRVVGLRPNIIGRGFAYHLDLDHEDPGVVQDIDVDYAFLGPVGKLVNESLFLMALRFPLKPEVLDDSNLDFCADDKILLTDFDYATGKKLRTAKEHIRGLMEDGCENTGDVRTIVLFGSLCPTLEPKADYIVDKNRGHGYALYPGIKYNFVKTAEPLYR